METDKVAVIGYRVSKKLLSQASEEKMKAYISNKKYIYGRILFTHEDYLTKYSKVFDRVSFRITDQENDRFRNGTLTGIIGMVNRSEIDIGVQPITMHEVSAEIVDFSYPYKLISSTFITRKANYKPQIFGILQIFSSPLWVAIISILIAISLIYCAILKKRYSFDKILIHAFAVLLRQSSVLKPSSVIENFLVSSWVVGAMFLCLAYDSVFLSFLAFPPMNPIKDVPELAKAVTEGHYHCIAIRRSAIFEMLLKSKQENLRIIGQDLKANNLSSDRNIFQDFLNGRSKQDLAFLVETDVADIFAVGAKFVSEDRFLEIMAAMPVRQDFCCKTLLEKFAHRLMASGLDFKYENDASFLIRIPRLLKNGEKDTSKRKLILTDVALAFIFLIFGHIVFFLVLIVEILSNRMKKVVSFKKNKRRRMRISYKNDSM